MLLRDGNRDGVAETRSVFLNKLHSPFGMALVGKTLYVAKTDAVLAFPYEQGVLSIDAIGKRLTELPAGPINHHWTKNIIANSAGTQLCDGWLEQQCCRKRDRQ
jgi:glucose/arabinose dehydrogenase